MNILGQRSRLGDRVAGVNYAPLSSVASDLQSRGRRFESLPLHFTYNHGQVVHTHVPLITKQYKLYRRKLWVHATQGGDWKCGSGKCDTVKIARMENAGLENAGADLGGEKCRTNPYGTPTRDYIETALSYFVILVLIHLIDSQQTVIFITL